jgi:hypothetical protein
MSIRKRFTNQIALIDEVVTKQLAAEVIDAPTIRELIRSEIQLSTAIPFIDEPEQEWKEGASEDEQPDELSPDEKKAQRAEQDRYQW